MCNHECPMCGEPLETRSSARFIFFFVMALIGVLFGLAALVAPVKGATYHGSDQIYLQAVGHARNASTTFSSDLTVTNLSADPIAISVKFTALNVTNPAIYARRDVFHLGPHEHRQIADFVGTVFGWQNAIGQVVLSACVEGADCRGTGENANYRQISVTGTVLSYANGADPLTAPTQGQALPGEPWTAYAYLPAAASGLDHVFIDGIRMTTHYRTNLGLANASEYSTTVLKVALINGDTGAVYNEVPVTLGPLANVQQSLATLFPPVNRMERRPPIPANAYVTVRQESAVPADDAAANGCADGCPGFFAYASRVDNLSGAATTLPAQFDRPEIMSVTAPALVVAAHLRMEKE